MVIAMTEKVKEILQNRDILIPRLLLLNYRKIGLSSDEFSFVVYLINSNFVFNPKQISDDLGISLGDVMSCMESLTSKGMVKLELKKNGNIRNEQISLDGLFDKLSYLFISALDEEKNTSIYDIFESEFGRTISPMEYEIIGSWLESGTSEETIVLALKEATYNGVSNLRYIDKIISEWNKKGIKTAEDVEKSRMNFKQKKSSKPANEILEYDWLNDE